MESDCIVAYPMDNVTMLRRKDGKTILSYDPYGRFVGSALGNSRIGKADSPCESEENRSVYS